MLGIRVSALIRAREVWVDRFFSLVRVLLDKIVCSPAVSGHERAESTETILLLI